MQLHTRPQFYLDVAEEMEYLADKAGPVIAARWQGEVEGTIKELLRHPGLGRPRPDLRPPDIRSWRVQNFRRWLIFYQVRAGVLVLQRVRYGAMNLEALDFAT